MTIRWTARRRRVGQVAEPTAGGTLHRAAEIERRPALPLPWLLQIALRKREIFPEIPSRNSWTRHLANNFASNRTVGFPVRKSNTKHFIRFTARIRDYSNKLLQKGDSASAAAAPVRRFSKHCGKHRAKSQNLCQPRLAGRSPHAYMTIGKPQCAANDTRKLRGSGDFPAATQAD